MVSAVAELRRLLPLPALAVLTFYDRRLFTRFFFHDRHLLPFPIHVHDCKRPKRNQVDTGYEFANESWRNSQCQPTNRTKMAATARSSTSSAGDNAPSANKGSTKI